MRNINRSKRNEDLDTKKITLLVDKAKHGDQAATFELFVSVSANLTTRRILSSGMIDIKGISNPTGLTLERHLDIALNAEKNDIQSNRRL